MNKIDVLERPSLWRAASGRLARHVCLEIRAQLHASTQQDVSDRICAGQALRNLMPETSSPDFAQWEFGRPNFRLSWFLRVNRIKGRNEGRHNILEFVDNSSLALEAVDLALAFPEHMHTFHHLPH